jgi:predicted enzyme related to lactoylglutathione lyase
MNTSRLEHVNVTVRDPHALAQRLQTLFDWKVRWEGPSLDDGYTLHVGDDHAYVAIYSHEGVQEADGSNYDRSASLNHIGVEVEDLDAAEERVRALGLSPHSHRDYDPGRRFYFDDPEGIEFEIVSYA